MRVFSGGLKFGEHLLPEWFSAKILGSFYHLLLSGGGTREVYTKGYRLYITVEEDRVVFSFQEPFEEVEEVSLFEAIDQFTSLAYFLRDMKAYLFEFSGSDVYFEGRKLREDERGLIALYSHMSLKTGSSYVVFCSGFVLRHADGVEVDSEKNVVLPFVRSLLYLYLESFSHAFSGGVKGWSLHRF